MKRWYILILSVTLILGCIFALSGSARNPANFTGKWYYAADGAAYLFHNGIIISEKHHILTDDDEIFSGAYSFGKDHILLFFISTDGIEETHELQLISDSSGDKLCRKTDSEVTVIFSRNKNNN